MDDIMFQPGDFELPLEIKLKLRVVNDEIDNCDDVKELREQLKKSTELMMNYQNIMNRMLREQIEKNLTDFTDKIEKGL
jgi:hypothetical protein